MDGHILTAWAEHCGGPGWRNTVVWVLVQTALGELRLDSLQPHELTKELSALVDVSATVADCMTCYVKRSQRLHMVEY
jgi:hypothetical protein